MSNKTDEIRANTLDQIERNERNYKLAFIGGGLVELCFFVAFLLLADLSNRVELLLLIAAVAIYSIVGFGLLAVGLHISRNTLRVLKAIDLLERK